MRFPLKAGLVEFALELLSVSEFSRLHAAALADGHVAGGSVAAMFTVVWLVSDEDSPYGRMSEAERWEEALANMGVTGRRRKDFLPLLEVAAEAYRRFNNHVYWRALRSIDGSIDNITRMLSETQPYIRKKEVSRNIGTAAEPEFVVTVSFESNAAELDEYYQRLGSFMKSREDIHRQYIQRREADQPRGDKATGALASGGLRNPATAKDFKR